MPYPALVVGLVAEERRVHELGHGDRSRWLAGAAPDSEIVLR